MSTQKHIVIFSHGFGVKKDSRGMFSDIVSSLGDDIECILFDYNIIDEISNTITIRPFGEQKNILENIINETKTKNPNAIIDIIAASQGCIITGLANPTGIHKIILLAPPFDLKMQKLIELFKQRSGTEINFNGISKLARNDGTVSIVPKEFWEETKNLNPIDIYNNLALSNDVTMVNANQDEILDIDNYVEIKNIESININGDHNFNGEYRIGLLETIKSLVV
jgi:hypothetical protein